MLSRTACRPSACLAPFLPSARSSAARCFIAARSSALTPSDSDSALFVGIPGLLSSFGTRRHAGPSAERLDAPPLSRFSIPARIGDQPRHILPGRGGGGCPPLDV